MAKRRNRRKSGIRHGNGGNEKTPISPVEEGSDEDLEDTLERIEPKDGRMVHPVRLTRGPKWWIQANVAGIPVGVILDTGAEVSVLTSQMWAALPAAVRANAKCHNRER